MRRRQAATNWVWKLGSQVLLRDTMRMTSPGPLWRWPFVAALFLQLLAPAGWCHPPEDWRREKRLIDVHMHMGAGKGGLDRSIGIMDQVGLGVGVNLSGGTVTHEPGKPSAFERSKAVADAAHPG